MRRGDRIASRFEILGEAGRGGMGTVFRARDWRDKRDVAVKVLAARSVDSVARFEREAAILSQLHHPNVVEYVAHGAVPDGPCWLVMEWVEGVTVADRLDGDGFDARETVALAEQIARALAALHALGIVHRDVKPSNLMLVGGEVAHVKLVDFGIARRTLEPAGLTRTGAMVGTAGYMAPEQARGEHAGIDGRTDLFALGCVMHECLTGDAAFRGESTLACRVKVLLHDPPRVRRIAPSLPAPLDALVASLLARSPDDRPADAAAVERALAALGEVPPTRAARVAPRTRNTTTYTPPLDDVQLCGVLVVAVDPDAVTRATAAIAAIAAAKVEPFDGGVAITIVGAIEAAARIALALAAQLPEASIAVIADESIDALVDRGAQLLAEVALAAEARGADACGVWLDPALGAAVAGAFAVERDGARLRLLRGVA